MTLAMDDVAADFGEMNADANRSLYGIQKCSPTFIFIEAARQIDETLGAQGYRIEEERCGQGRWIRLHGGSDLAQQWAAYDLMRALGVRYLHPEQTFYPERLVWPERDLNTTASPFFKRRSLGLHRTHPVELSSPLDPEGIDMAGYQRNWIDWQVKIRNSTSNGFDREFVGNYAYRRGFPRSSGFNLLNTQQGGRPILDPDDPRSEEEQLAEAIATQMRSVGGLPDVSSFGFGFNPSEFTEADDQDTVRRLTFIADYFAEQHPGVELFTTNHGTAGPPTEFYGVRFYDLPQFAPDNLGATVHPLMFYDLQRAAPVYGNENFSHMLAWIRREAEVRPIEYFPESSWWLTFDLPVPLYLAPTTIEARAFDVELLEDLVVSDVAASEPGVSGHRLFTSGQEWGYWLIDWCFSHMSFERGFGMDACFDLFLEGFGGRAEIKRILIEFELEMRDRMRDPDVLRYLVGSDDETEIAFETGIVFHPLPPRPESVIGYSDEEAALMRRDSLVSLAALASKAHALAAQVDALIAEEPEHARPWLREVRDGIEVTALRAEHAVAIYETALSLRSALNAGDLPGVTSAFDGLEQARALTEEARTVVRAREAEYRYPDALTIDGDEPGSSDAVINKTIYPYRYLSRTHRMFYWTRPDEQLASLFGDGLDVVRVNGRVLTEGTPLDIEVIVQDIEELQLDYGDGTVQTATITDHVYEGQGFFDWSLDVRHASGVLHFEDQVAIVERRIQFTKRALKVKSPEGGEIIDALLPGLVFGFGEDTEPFLVLGRLDDRNTIATRGTLQRRPRTGLSSGPLDLSLTLRDVGNVTVYDATLRFSEGDGPERRMLSIDGIMRTADIVDLLVSTGGFEPVGAQELVASILDYTPETLPDELPFLIEARGTEAEP